MISSVGQNSRCHCRRCRCRNRGNECPAADAALPHGMSPGEFMPMPNHPQPYQPPVIYYNPAAMGCCLLPGCRSWRMNAKTSSGSRMVRTICRSSTIPSKPWATVFPISAGVPTAEIGFREAYLSIGVTYSSAVFNFVPADGHAGPCGAAGGQQRTNWWAASSMTSLFPFMSGCAAGRAAMPSTWSRPRPAPT